MAEHTPAQLALRRTMEQISQEHWAAGWYSGLERILWRWITEPGAGAVLAAEEREVLCWLADEVDGWFHWPIGAAEPQFVGRRQWQYLFDGGETQAEMNEVLGPEGEA
jgi:hypothetical protein